MCMDRVTNGMKPACVTACPTGALMFGSRDDMLELARARKALLAAEGYSPRIYGETELGGLGAMYLLPEKASLYGLPEDPKLPHARIISKWLLGVVPGLAILYGMWRSFSKDAAEAQTGGE